jgi:MATE family multidrug resistance protein
MPPREFLSEEGDEEMLAPTAMDQLPTAKAEPNEETSLLVIMPSNSNGRLLKHKRDTWTSMAQREVVEQSKTFLPALQSMVLSKIPWFITLRILGEMDDGSAFGGEEESNSNHSGGIELAAAALATSLCNVTGMSLCVGFSFALSTLAGQAKGEMVSRSSSNAKGSVKESSSFLGGPGCCSDDDSESTPNIPVVFLLRGLLIQLMLVLPVGIWWLFGIEDFLIKLGQTPELANHAATYLKILAPSLWVYSIQWTMTAWTQSIGMADVPAWAALLGLVLHIPFNVLFCYVLGMGYLGCAYATIMFQTVQCTYIVSYLFVNTKGRQRVLESTGGSAVGRTTLTLTNELKIAAGSLRAFCDYLGLAIPGLIIISEWWASEVAIFLSGRLSPNPQTTLAAMTIYQSINAFGFMVPAGFSVAGTARVGNLLGAGNPVGASLAGKVSVGLCAVCSGVIGVILYSLPHSFFPGLFLSASENRAIVDQTAATIPLLAFYVFADGVQTGLNGIIKGCGRQRIVVPIVLVAYWVVGVPLAYYFGLYRSGGDDTLCAHIASDGTYDPSEGGLVLCGDVGLVAGMTTGTWCHMLLLAVVVICTTNWENEADKAKQRVIADQTHRERQKRQKQRKQDTDRENQKSRLRSSRSDGHLY